MVFDQFDGKLKFRIYSKGSLNSIYSTVILDIKAHGLLKYLRKIVRGINAEYLSKLWEEISELTNSKVRETLLLVNSSRRFKRII